MALLRDGCKMVIQIITEIASSGSKQSIVSYFDLSDDICNAGWLCNGEVLMHNDHNPHELLSTIILSSNAETDVVIYVQQAITSH